MKHKFKRKPLALSVGVADWKLTFVPEIEYDGQKAVGLTEYKKRSVSVEDNQPLYEEISTVVHELLHVLISEYDLKELLDNDIDTEEKLVNTIGDGFAAMLKHSPDLRKYLIETLKKGG